MKKIRTAAHDKNYIVDPATRRSKFIENNKAAMIHGGYSVEIPPSIVDALLDNDLGFELGILKGQLCNITIIGKRVINSLIAEGEETTALNVGLSCADRSVKIILQIQKLLESKLTKPLPDHEKTNRSRTRWLKQLYIGNCSPSDVAFQFEINQLGQLPDYVQQMLSKELAMQQINAEHDNLSREDILAKIEDYKASIAMEKEQIKQREQSVSIEKQRINQQLFANSEPVENNN
ncbi:hypothetical protein [Shewanella xiamenensis]|uniref:hypothetical protein n=1 Tax=Shewanella xiamenensis TaxID=332186 RepID=UPI001F06D01C|nr:hypothetical protein [Shewanella xiamenensis]UML94181.1 hypothetical protein MKD32_02240 [Shewanella xiamenensis]